MATKMATISKKFHWFKIHVPKKFNFTSEGYFTHGSFFVIASDKEDAIKKGYRLFVSRRKQYDGRFGVPKGFTFERFMKEGFKATRVSESWRREEILPLILEDAKVGAMIELKGMDASYDHPGIFEIVKRFNKEMGPPFLDKEWMKYQNKGHHCSWGTSSRDAPPSGSTINYLLVWRKPLSRR